MCEYSKWVDCCLDAWHYSLADVSDGVHPAANANFVAYIGGVAKFVHYSNMVRIRPLEELMLQRYGVDLRTAGEAIRRRDANKWRQTIKAGMKSNADAPSPCLVGTKLYSFLLLNPIKTFWSQQWMRSAGCLVQWWCELLPCDSDCSSYQCMPLRLTASPLHKPARLQLLSCHKLYRNTFYNGRSMELRLVGCCGRSIVRWQKLSEHWVRFSF